MRSAIIVAVLAVLVFACTSTRAEEAWGAVGGDDEKLSLSVGFRHQQFAVALGAGQVREENASWYRSDYRVVTAVGQFYFLRESRHAPYLGAGIGLRKYDPGWGEFYNTDDDDEVRAVGVVGYHYALRKSHVLLGIEYNSELGFLLKAGLRF